MPGWARDVGFIDAHACTRVSRNTTRRAGREAHGREVKAPGGAPPGGAAAPRPPGRPSSRRGRRWLRGCSYSASKRRHLLAVPTVLGGPGPAGAPWHVPPQWDPASCHTATFSITLSATWTSSPCTVTAADRPHTCWWSFQSCGGGTARVSRGHHLGAGRGPHRRGAQGAGHRARGGGLCSETTPSRRCRETLVQGRGQHDPPLPPMHGMGPGHSETSARAATVRALLSPAPARPGRGQVSGVPPAAPHTGLHGLPTRPANARTPRAPPSMRSGRFLAGARPRQHGQVGGSVGHASDHVTCSGPPHASP